MPSSNSVNVTGEPPVSPSVALSSVVTWTLSLTSLKRLLAEGTLDPEESIVLMNTGSGYKYLDLLTAR